MKHLRKLYALPYTHWEIGNHEEVREVLRQALERRIGSLSNIEFVTIMAMTTEDIKFNRIKFKKCTSLEYVLDIAERSFLVFRRCA